MTSSQDERRRTKKREFALEAAIVLLIFQVTIETLSLFDWSPQLLPNIPYFAGRALLSISVIFSFLALYGLMKRSSKGAYFSLSASLFWSGLGAYSLQSQISATQFDPLLTTRAVLTIILGSLTIICVFSISKDWSDDKNPTPLDFSSEILEGREHSIYALETVNLQKKYKLGDNVVLAINGIDLKVKRGEFISIMGPSGSGKSTLLNLIGALDKPTSGQVLIGGIPISAMNERNLATLRNEKIGFVFQAYNLISRSTVLRNMELPTIVKGLSKQKRLTKIRELLKIVGLTDKILRKPKTLSGGEQQRVAIARALVNDPEILLADEPTGNVDSKQGTIIMRFLRELNTQKGSTIIVVTHDPEVARLTDRIVYIRDGKIETGQSVEGLTA